MHTILIQLQDAIDELAALVKLEGPAYDIAAAEFNNTLTDLGYEGDLIDAHITISLLMAESLPVGRILLVILGLISC